MIPMSAAAAESRLPDLQALTVDNNTVALEGDTFAADIAMSAEKVTVTAEVGLRARLYAQSVDGVSKVTISNGTDITFSQVQKTVEGNVITIPLTLASEDGTNSKAFKLVLTKSTQGTTTNLKSVSVPAGSQVITASMDQSAKEITVTVPREFTDTDAKITVTTEDNATVNNTNKTTDEIDLSSTTFSVKSQSGTNVATWKINVNKVEGLSSFAIDGVEGVFSDTSDDNIDVNDTITVTLPREKVLNSYGEVVESPVLPVSFTVLANTKVLMDGTNEVANGAKVTFTELNSVSNAGELTYGSFKVNCNGVNQAYTLKVVVEKSSDAAISYAQLNNEIATISGNKITAELPATGYDNTKVVVVLRTATSVTGVTINTAETSATFESETPAGKDYTEWTLEKNGSAATADLSKGAIITVTAQDGSTKQYTVSVTKAENVDEAYLSALILKNGDTECKGDIKGTTITFTVPYMTKSVATWKLFATPSTGAAAKLANNTPIVNGTTPTDWTDSLADKAVTIKNAVTAVNKTNPAVSKTYDVVIALETAKIGKTLNSLSVTSTTKTNPKEAYRGITADNTVSAVIDQTKKTVTLKPAASQANNTNYVIDFATAIGGVAFVDNAEVTKATEAALGTTLAAGKEIVVLPEVIAKKVSGNAKDLAADGVGTVYTVKVEAKEALKDSALKSISVGGVKLTVAADGTISGTIPYSATAAAAPTSGDSVTDPAMNSQFLEFELGKYAMFGFEENGPADYHFASKGDTNGDGEPDAFSKTNMKVVFVRNDDHTVNAYVFYAEQGSKPAKLAVYSEEAVLDGKVAASNAGTYSTYKFDLKWADPNTEAKITSFKLANSSASISGRTINVTVPYNTKLNGLVPTFTTSEGATVTAGSTKLESGKTVLDFTNDVTLLVTSEDNKTTVNYTVKVKVSEQFSDVKQGDWFYNEVMTAAANGWVDGTGNGKFSPYEGMKRGDFAKIVAAIDNADLSKYTDSAFPDVPSDKYYSAAVAYCADKGYIGGDEKGYFNGEKMITREEAAKIMCNVKGLTPVTEPTTKFADDAKISNWAKGYVYACKEAKIFGGDEKNCFNASSTMQRCEGAAILVRAFA